ncbi:MAG: hypothetical protein R3A48_09475 [Polyangiales bacterium]
MSEARELRPGASVPVVTSFTSQPAPEPSTQSTAAPAPPPLTRPAARPNQPVGVAQQPLDAVARPESSSGGVAGGVNLEAALSMYEARLGAAVTLLRADAATCRDVCGASATICRAAAEICRLTGDDDREAAHPRCRSARLSCAEAGRQRDGACPTCPDAR